MIRLFQRNTALQVVLILLALLLLWLRPLIAPPAMEAGEHPAVLYGLLCQALSGVPRMAVVLAMLLVLVSGVVFNLLLANVGLVSQNSLFPTFIYVLISSAGATTLTPVLLVNAVLIACLHPLMLRGTLLTIPVGQACAATAMIGLATLIYQPAVAYMLTYLLIAASYRLYSWRDWMVMLLGFAVPYSVLLLVLYMDDGIPGWWQTTVDSLSSIGFVAGSSEPLPLTGGLALAVVMLWSLVYTGGRLGERPVLWQKNAGNVMLMLLGSLGMMLFAPILPLSPALFALPFTFCVNRLAFGRGSTTTGYGRRKRYPWVSDALILVVIIAVCLC